MLRRNLNLKCLRVRSGMLGIIGTIPSSSACPEVGWYTFTSRGVLKDFKEKNIELLLLYLKAASNEHPDWMHQMHFFDSESLTLSVRQHEKTDGLTAGEVFLSSYAQLSAGEWLSSVPLCLVDICRKTGAKLGILLLSQYSLDIPVLSR